ncbi:MAG: sulfite exporter TauE/SafE family protein [Deltaproteobacteria bacterium]|nr:sulfite exporter TauE/SafE family protein [Deltaproteobacteria bacterium]
MTYAFAFAGGLAGSLHCVAMCGAFPLALARGRTQGRFGRQLLYNLGRLNTLVFVGALSGAFGAVVVEWGPLEAAKRVLALAAGAVLILVGLEMLGLVRGLTVRVAAAVQGTLGRSLRGVITSSSPAAPIALGVMNAFLPCHLIYAFAARAVSLASPIEGALTMLAFGAGTVPAMLGVALVGERLPARLRLGADRVVALLMVLYGIVVALQGFGTTAGHVH